MVDVVGLTGVVGSGKTLIANYMVNCHGFVRVPFAFPMKQMLASLPGVTHEMLWGSTKEKEMPREIFGGKSAREVMQNLGAGWGRETIYPDFWVDMWKRTAMKFPRVVCDDVRYLNEAAAVRSLGGDIWKIQRCGAGSAVNPNHSSETELVEIKVSRVIMNNGTVDDLLREIDASISVQ
jgi:hypothetical protein